eukprot:Gregarina_sp_Poly_1__5354@NODE_282_length_10089_cov_123_197964_g244_i0_p1_GENE_NODE_282_length_10089_cov_123_197964_g244_i0NODE_282_length_10089_cov_123_197964_g244_i0_p1_ORF_typecomplete_len737_score90_33CheYbinding/PF09078_11/0_33_NODE_282_length_10089_cov_123_197964_g244_i039556165
MVLHVRATGSEKTRKLSLLLPAVFQVVSSAEADVTNETVVRMQNEPQSVTLNLDDFKLRAVDEFCRKLTGMQNHYQSCPEVTLLMEFVYDRQIEQWTPLHTVLLVDYCEDAILFGDRNKKSAGEKLLAFMNEKKNRNLEKAFSTLSTSQEQLLKHTEQIPMACNLTRREDTLNRYFKSVASTPGLLSQLSLREKNSAFEPNKQIRLVNEVRPILGNQSPNEPDRELIQKNSNAHFEFKNQSSTSDARPTFQGHDQSKNQLSNGVRPRVMKKNSPRLKSSNKPSTTESRSLLVDRPQSQSKPAVQTASAGSTKKNTPRFGANGRRPIANASSSSINPPHHQFNNLTPPPRALRPQIIQRNLRSKSNNKSSTADSRSLSTNRISNQPKKPTAPTPRAGSVKKNNPRFGSSDQRLIASASSTSTNPPHHQAQPQTSLTRAHPKSIKQDGLHFESHDQSSSIDTHGCGESVYHGDVRPFSDLCELIEQCVISICKGKTSEKIWKILNFLVDPSQIQSYLTSLQDPASPEVHSPQISAYFVHYIEECLFKFHGGSVDAKAGYDRIFGILYDKRDPPPLLKQVLFEGVPSPLEAEDKNKEDINSLLAARVARMIFRTKELDLAREICQKYGKTRSVMQRIILALVKTWIKEIFWISYDEEYGLPKEHAEMVSVRSMDELKALVRAYFRTDGNEELFEQVWEDACAEVIPNSDGDFFFGPNFLFAQPKRPHKAKALNHNTNSI